MLSGTATAPSPFVFLTGSGKVYAALALFNRLIAGPNGRSASQQSSHAALLPIRPGAMRTVKRVGSKPDRICVHSNGMETGAPSRSRGDSGATAVAIRSLRR